ncbi:MAG TPA: hypothetical protein PKI32_08255, partial [Opitutales bacterium]|nr:hypothetical protein [Opitutales bacterium]
MGIVTFLSVFLYGIGNLVSMPAVSPDGFIPQSLDAAPSPHSWLAKLSPLFVLLYALSFLPVVVLFTIEKYRIDPPAMIVGGCLLVVSLLVELINALPLTALMLAPVRRPSMSPEEVRVAVNSMLSDKIVMSWWQLGIVILLTGVAAYLGSYLKKKGENLATKEDIKTLTQSVESVRTEYMKQLEDYKAELARRTNAVD